MPQSVGTRSGGLYYHEEGDLPSAGGSKRNKWLWHTGFKHSFESENDKWLMPTSSRYSFWSGDDERLPPPLLLLVLGRAVCAAAKRASPPRPIGELGSQLASKYRMLAFFWKRG